MGEEPGVCLNVKYGADVLSGDLNCVGSYATDGGTSFVGEIGYARPPVEAPYVWFDFSATDDPEGEHRVTRLTVDLATGQVLTETMMRWAAWRKCRRPSRLARLTCWSPRLRALLSR